MSQATLPHLSLENFHRMIFGTSLRMCLYQIESFPACSVSQLFFIKIMICAKKTRKEHSFTKRSKWLTDNWSFKNEFLVPSRGLYQCSMATVNLTSLSNKTAAYQHVSYNWLTSPQLVTVLFFAGPAGGQLCRHGFDPKEEENVLNFPWISHFPSPKHCARLGNKRIKFHKANCESFDIAIRVVVFGRPLAMYPRASAFTGTYLSKLAPLQKPLVPSEIW